MFVQFFGQWGCVVFVCFLNIYRGWYSYHLNASDNVYCEIYWYIEKWEKNYLWIQFSYLSLSFGVHFLLSVHNCLFSYSTLVCSREKKSCYSQISLTRLLLVDFYIASMFWNAAANSIHKTLAVIPQVKLNLLTFFSPFSCIWQSIVCAVFRYTS